MKYIPVHVCIYRGMFIAAIAAMIALLLSQYAQACSYRPDPVTIPPTVEVRL
mgnify:CR=1 FL=1